MEIKSKKYIVSLLITVFGLIALISSTSYAILRGSTTSSNTHIVKAGSVELEVNEKYNSMETGFSIMKDTEGLQLETVYEFTITNIGSVPAKYDLKLMNTAPSGQTALDDSYIRIGLEVNGQEMGPMGLANVNNVIDSNTINNEEIIRYKMRVWLDKNKKTQIEQNTDKKAYLSLKVEAKQSAYTPKVNHYVYRNGTDTVSNGSPLAAGTYNGYCYIDTNEDYNSCTGDNFGFLTQGTCNSYINGWDGTTCESGSWTTTGTTYTENATTLNKQFYLRYNIGTQTEVNESYVCYILNNNEYCLKGGDGVYDNTLDGLVSPSYESNKQILNESFGASNCNETNETGFSYYLCSSDSLHANAGSHGYVNAGVDDSYCSVSDRGNSSCYGEGVSPDPGGGLL